MIIEIEFDFKNTEDRAMKRMVEVGKIRREVIGAWKITTKDGNTWFADRLKGELLETAIADANATFGDGCRVTPW